MAKAVLLTNFSWVGISTPVINTAGYLIEHGWEVTLITIGADFNRFPLPQWMAPPIQVLSLESHRLLPKQILSVTPYLRRVSHDAELIFAFDAAALFCTILTPELYRSRVVYYSLEFFEPRRYFVSFRKLVERFCTKYCVGVVTQHQTRAEFLRQSLSPRAVWVVPNSPRGPYLGPVEKPNGFRDGGTRDVVLLCIGTLGRVVCLDTLLQWFESQDGAVKLVLHGWFIDKELELYARQIQEAKPSQLIISDKLVDDAEKTDIYLSCDVVFVGFSRTSENLRLAAGSAGKLYDALRTGRPILAIDSPGMREIVEGNGVGKVVSNGFELGQGLDWIIKKYSEIQKNCKTAHDHYSHDRHFSQMIDDVITQLNKLRSDTVSQ